MAQTLRDRFYAKVVLPETNEGCWVWTGWKTVKGYGKISREGKGKGPSVYAHRLAYELHTGEIPVGNVVCHSCDNPSCVNPAHLFVGTQVDNLRDMASKGRSLRGERQPNAKLTESNVIEIFAMRRDGAKLSVIGDRFGVGKSHVHGVLTRKTWKHLAQEEVAS